MDWGQPVGWNPTRLLQVGDLGACLVLDATALGGFWSESQWRAELEGAGRLCIGIDQADPLIPDGLVAEGLVAEGLGPGGLAGVACGWLVVDELHITVLAVDPQGRRRGQGRQLLEALLAAARARGALHATLEVAADNQAALGLYAACGFQTAGTRRGYYRSGQDALIQWKRITAAASDHA